MKSLLSTAGALALLMSAAACGAPETATIGSPGAPQVADTDEAMNDDIRVAETAASYTLASGEYEASDLIGAPVHNAAGEEIAALSDVWFGNDGAAPMFIVRDGGVAGVGGDLRTVAYNVSMITPDPEDMDGEPDVFVKLTDASLESMPEFEQATNDDYRLASEKIASTVAVSYSGESARIKDLILSETGQARYAVISPDLASTDQILVDAGNISVAEGDADGELILDVTAEDFKAAPAYPRD
ncbi:MAG: PRC-barrel domain-containing protein [Cucumibacter sp.]